MRRIVEIEWTRTIPRRIKGTESAVEKISKVATVLVGGDLVVGIDFGVVDASDTQQDLDAAGLAVGNILLDGLAVAQHVRLGAVLVVEVAAAVGCEAHAGPVGDVVLGSLLDEGEGCVFDAGVAVVGEAVVDVAILALQTWISIGNEYDLLFD